MDSAKLATDPKPVCGEDDGRSDYPCQNERECLACLACGEHCECPDERESDYEPE